MEYSVVKLKEKMEKHGFSFKKMFGQNFIIDENIIKNIVRKSEVDDKTLVIEIGPGAGSLTSGLCKKAKNVLCYEIDSSLESLLKENLKDYSNYKIIFNDFLKANVLEDIKNYEYSKLYVVSNLPYYITTPIIMKLIKDKIPVQKIVVMVQKEVGNRFKADPGSKEYGSLSVFLNYYFDVKKIMEVSKNVFVPKPNVDSIVVEFVKKNTNLKIINEEHFFKLVRDSFVQKRKTIKNNLKNYNLNLIEKILNRYGLNLSARAEQLSIECFAEISNELCK